MFKLSKTTLSAPQIWKNSFSLYKNNVSKVLFFAFVAAILPKLPELHWSQTYLLKTGSTVTFSYITYEVISALIVVFLGALITHYLYISASDPKKKLSGSIKPVLKKYLHILISNFIVLILLVALFIFMLLLTFGLSGKRGMQNMTTDYLMAKIGIAFLLWAIPALFISILCITVTASILFENKNCFSAIGRSIELVWGNWWRTFVAFFVPLVVIMIIMSILETIVTDTKLIIVVGSLFSSLTMPFIMSLILLQFNDLQLRKNNSLKQG